MIKEPLAADGFIGAIDMAEVRERWMLWALVFGLSGLNALFLPFFYLRCTMTADRTGPSLAAALPAPALN